LRITVIGCGHIGLVTGICFSHLGHRVTLADQDAAQVKVLEEGHLPIYEEGLGELFQRGRAENRVTISRHVAQAVEGAEVVYICVGVPTLENGDADYAALDLAAGQIAQTAHIPKLIVLGGTVPVHSGAKLAHILAVYSREGQQRFSVAGNPHFIREGTAVQDFFHPDRILLGVEDAFSDGTLREIYRPLLEQNFRCPFHLGGCPARKPPEMLATSVQSAELIKYVSNTFLAVKISYANVLADLCERLGGDIKEVSRAIGLDPRIGPQFLEAGIGFGGTRLPEHLRGFCRLTERTGVEAGIAQAAEEVNRRRISLFFEKLRHSLWVLDGKRIGLFGLAHKAGTDDLRGSPAIHLFLRLSAEGAHVRAYDPRAIVKAKAAFSTLVCCADAYDAANHADALIVGTDWPEFRELDWERIRKSMARPIVFDGRNLLSPKEMRALGFEYHSVGRADSR
jgi:UDPglucose 6-dehydrogenase